MDAGRVVGNKFLETSGCALPMLARATHKGKDMIRIMLWIALLAPALALGQSYKKPPSDGYWWNPSEGGRGWSFETNNEITAITHYTYDAQGSSIFLQSVGIHNPGTGVLSSNVLGFSGGQCVGCTYRNPTTTNQGAIEFSFSSRSRGQVRYPNGTLIPIERFEFGFPARNSKTQGAWATTWFSALGSDFTHYIYISGKCSICTTADTYQGTTELIRPGRNALVSNVGDTLLAIVDAGTFYDYYYFLAETNRWYGLGCTASKTSPPPSVTACTGLMYGMRDKGLEEARASFGQSRKSATTPSWDAERHALMSAPKAMSRPDIAVELDAPGLAEAAESLLSDMRNQ